MTQQNDKDAAAEALRRALAAKQARTRQTPEAGQGGRGVEKAVQHRAAALNKPAFRRASKRG